MTRRGNPESGLSPYRVRNHSRIEGDGRQQRRQIAVNANEIGGRPDWPITVPIRESPQLKATRSMTGIEM